MWYDAATETNGLAADNRFVESRGFLSATPQVMGAALLPAVGTCVVLAFGAMPGRSCFLRVTPQVMHGTSDCAHDTA